MPLGLSCNERHWDSMSPFSVLWSWRCIEGMASLELGGAQPGQLYTSTPLEPTAGPIFSTLAISPRVGSCRSKFWGYSWRGPTRSLRCWLCWCDPHGCSFPDPILGWVLPCSSYKHMQLCFNQEIPALGKAHCCSKHFRLWNKSTVGTPWLLSKWRRRNAWMQEECPVADRGPRWHLVR